MMKFDEILLATYQSSLFKSLQVEAGNNRQGFYAQFFREFLLSVALRTD